MASVAQDQLLGVNASQAIKVPCAMASTSNITLTAEQTIDGQTSSASRVLLTGQTDGTENGIWISDSGAWSRAPDWDGADDVVTGTLVRVHSGTSNSGTWKVTTTGTITPGTTSVTLTKTDVDAEVRADLIDTTDDTLNDALVKGKRTDTNAQAFTIHTYNENRKRNAVTDYGLATGSGSAAANKTALENAITDLVTAGGGELWIPAGNWYITNWDLSSKSSVEIVIVGEARKDTSLNYTATTGAIFDLTSSRFLHFENLNLINQTGEPTAGELFDMNNADDCHFQNLRISSAYDGFVFQNGASNNHLKDIEFLTYTTYTWNWPVRVVGSCSSLRMTDVTYQESNTCTGGFVSIEDSGGSGIDTFRMLRCSAQKQSSGLIPEGIVIENGEFVNILQSNFECGTASAVGIKIEGGTNIHLNDVHCVSNLVGVSVTNVGGLQINGGRIYFNDNEGIKITTGTDIGIKGTHVFDNGQAAANTYDGISAAASTVKDISIVGVKVGSIRGSIVKLDNGINVSGAAGDVVVVGCDIDDDCVNGVGVKHTFGNAGDVENVVVIEGNAGAPESVVPSHTRTRTTDATITTLWSYTLNDNEHLHITATVIYQGSSGTSTGSYILAATVYRDGGTATLVGAVTTVHSAEHNASMDCTIDVDTNDVRVRGTGIAANTFDWHVNIEILGKVSSA